MPILRLAYTTQFLIALIAVFVLWAQVGGQSHLDLLPWFIKLGLGVAAAYATVRATAAAVGGERGWNGHSLRWAGVALVLACLCGLASYYAHMYLEDDQEADPQQQDTTISRLEPGVGAMWDGLATCCGLVTRLPASANDGAGCLPLPRSRISA